MKEKSKLSLLQNCEIKKVISTKKKNGDGLKKKRKMKMTVTKTVMMYAEDAETDDENC